MPRKRRKPEEIVAKLRQAARCPLRVLAMDHDAYPAFVDQPSRPVPGGHHQLQSGGREWPSASDRRHPARVSIPRQSRGL